MTNRKRRILPAVVAGALSMGAAAAFAADNNQQDLQNQVKALEAKVASLEGKQSAQTADEVSLCRLCASRSGGSLGL